MLGVLDFFKKYLKFSSNPVKKVLELYEVISGGGDVGITASSRDEDSSLTGSSGIAGSGA